MMMMMIFVVVIHLLFLNCLKADPFPNSVCHIPDNVGILPVFDGDDWKNTVEYATVSPNTGACRTNAALLEPDLYHWSSIAAADPPAWRANWRLFDVLQIWMRCDNPQNWKNISMLLNHWQPAGSNISSYSRTVFLHRYMSFPRSDITDWTRIRIPLQDLAVPTWSLGGVERLMFYAAGLPTQCYVDNIALLDLTGLKVTSPSIGINSANIISFNVSKAFDISSARNQRNFYLMSPNDPAYLMPVHPVEVGSLRKMLGWDEENTVLTQNTIYLQFPYEMKDGKDYRLTIGYALLSASQNPTVETNLTFTYWENHVVSSFQLNQQGFLPYQSKKIFVNDYFGDIGSAVFAVGSGGAIYSFDKYSSTWNKHTVLGGKFHEDLHGVAAVHEKDVIAVGGHGSILRYDGLAWTTISSGTQATLFDIKISAKGRGFIVGEGNTLLHNENILDESSGWHPFAAYSSTDHPSIAGKAFRSISLFADDSFIVGGGGFILIYWNQQWFIETIGNVAVNCVTGAYQRTASDTTISFGDRGYHSVSKYGTQQVWDWKKLTQVRSSANVSSINWKGCWNDPFSFAYATVGSDGTILVGDYPGLGGSYVAMKKLARTGSFNAIDCIHAYDCYAVGDGFIATGGISQNNPKVSSAWSADWTVTTIDASVKFNAVSAVMQGSLRLTSSQKKAYLVDAEDISHQFVEIPLQMYGMNSVMAGGDIWLADFSSFTRSGSYRLYIKGLGVSYPFVISNDALTLAAWHSCRSFYYQRQGTALTAPFSDPRWARPIDHEFNTTKGGRKIDAAYHWSLRDSAFYKNETICPLSNDTCSDDSMRDTAGGWFDAGDFGKYIMGSASVTWRLLNSYEMHPSNYSDDWNIPESRNGIADVIDEVKWELDWMEKMQTDDGGVYNKVAGEVWEARLPQVSDLGGHSVRYILEQSTGETAIHGAAFAQAARIFRSIDSKIAARYLDRARRAYRFLKKYPTNLPVGGVVNPPGHVSGAYTDDDDRDNRCWLIAELYRTTCDHIYAVEFEALYKQNVCGIGWNDLQQSGVRAQWAYYAASCAPINQTITRSAVVASIRQNFATELDTIARYVRQNPYPSVARMDVIPFIDGHAQVFPAKDLIMMVQMFPERQQEIERYMRNQVDLALGANALSKSIVTGLGYDRVLRPLQWSTRSLSFTLNLHDEPCPGFNVFGASSHLPFSNPPWRTAYSDVNNYPSMYAENSPYPVLRRFVDHPFMAGMTEFGLGTQGPLCSILMYLKNSTFDSLQGPEDVHSLMPSIAPTVAPTRKPIAAPTTRPSTGKPTAKPSPAPTAKKPTAAPSKKPAAKPTAKPTRKGTSHPTRHVSKKPTPRPTGKPISNKPPSFRPTHKG